MIDANDSLGWDLPQGFKEHVKLANDKFLVPSAKHEQYRGQTTMESDRAAGIEILPTEALGNSTVMGKMQLRKNSKDKKFHKNGLQT